MVLMNNTWNIANPVQSSGSVTDDEQFLNTACYTVKEGDSEFRVEAEVDGLIPRNLMISVEGNWMYVSGDRILDTEVSGNPAGIRVPFDATIKLPFDDTDRYYLDITEDRLQFRFPKVKHSVQDAA